MANLQVKDAAAASKYLSATGAGTDGDPHIIQHEVTQDTPDDLNANANLQVGDVDVGAGNPVPVDATGQGDVPVTLDGETVDVSDRIGRLLGKMTHYDVLANGTITALNGTVELTCAGMGTVGLGITGTWVGTLVAEVEVGDGVWDPIPLIENTLAGASLSTTANGNWLLGVAGSLTLRIRASLWTSGTATIYLNASAATAGVFLSLFFAPYKSNREQG